MTEWRPSSSQKYKPTHKIIICDGWTHPFFFSYKKNVKWTMRICDDDKTTRRCMKGSGQTENVLPWALFN